MIIVCIHVPLSPTTIFHIGYPAERGHLTDTNSSSSVHGQAETSLIQVERLSPAQELGLTKGAVIFYREGGPFIRDPQLLIFGEINSGPPLGPYKKFAPLKLTFCTLGFATGHPKVDKCIVRQLMNVPFSLVILILI